ncbi:thioredoxin family protein [Methanolobus sp. WCC5]|uniref:thioredoxin family protein n=1 Tax=Methanolobus sp. WCC5 TaxID=3125785 RepID=UPI00324D96E2
MNKIILSAIAIIALLFITAGLTGSNNGLTDDSAILTVTNIQELDDAIEKGPVLVEIGTDRCPACIALKPILVDIANEYEGKATVAYINADRTGALAASFRIYSIPDSFVIAQRTDQGYVYMGTDGQTTTERNKVRFLGLTGKRTLTNALDAAIEYRK